ncbi:DUF1801 domain-containing protein [Emticicia sp. CRIBPO]|uniref:DUF1801 domain-containing protein n=1 Tax=Emticicia sp. CRIBPO TaxID=2683258 RepID=UPI00141229C9|nr:DUF1801 domain-containing protein [Emticicia sp. CRIBPO]NBA88584.1 DUF1801 domain-containing protein [Emticicia sp. CRIBPO]
MLSPIDQYFSEKNEPLKSCLQFLRGFILNYSPDIREEWRYSMPFYTWKTKRFCYLWVHKKYELPYVGFVDGNKMDHSGLLTEKRSRMKIWLVDLNEDVDVEVLKTLLIESISLIHRKVEK